MSESSDRETVFTRKRQPMPPVPSAVHRWLKITPGNAPWWLDAQDGCGNGGIDLPMAIMIGLFVGIVAGFQVSVWVSAGSLILEVLFCKFVVLPFGEAESKARRLMKRAERRQFNGGVETAN